MLLRLLTSPRTVDGQSIEDFSENLVQNLAMLVKELKDKTYRPQPVKRVEIPKTGGAGRIPFHQE